MAHVWHVWGLDFSPHSQQRGVCCIIAYAKWENKQAKGVTRTAIFLWRLQECGLHSIHEVWCPPEWRSIELWALLLSLPWHSRSETVCATVCCTVNQSKTYVQVSLCLCSKTSFCALRYFSSLELSSFLHSVYLFFIFVCSSKDRLLFLFML